MPYPREKRFGLHFLVGDERGIHEQMIANELSNHYTLLLNNPEPTDDLLQHVHRKCIGV